MAIKIDFFPWREPMCDCTAAYCPSSLLPFSGLSFVFYHQWFRLSPSWQGPSFCIRLCLKQRHLLLVFWKYKECSRSMPLSWTALRRQRQRSCWIDALGRTEAEPHFGLSQTCQRTLRIFPSKDHSQGKSSKSTDDCQKAYNTENCLTCPTKWSRRYQQLWLL